MSVVSDSVRPHRRQLTRLPHPWDSPGKNTGVGCYFLLQCMKVKSEREVAQSCPTLSMDCSLPGSSIHGIFPGKSTGVGCHCLLHCENLVGSKTQKSGWLPSAWVLLKILLSEFSTLSLQQFIKYSSVFPTPALSPQEVLVHGFFLQ